MPGPAAGGHAVAVHRVVPHTCCNLSALFYKEDDDTTVIADGFPLLNALKETHLLLAEGAHNQFGDLPWTARHEMLISSGSWPGRSCASSWRPR